MDDDISNGLGDIRVAIAGGGVPVSLPVTLPRPATGAEIAQFVALRAAACVGADYSNLALLDPRRRLDAAPVPRAVPRCVSR